MAGYWLHLIRAFFITCQLIVIVITAQHCGKESSLYGKMLSGHTLKTVKTAHPWQCTQECTAHDKCQSINYVISAGKCELNDRTKEASPADFVPNEDHLYMKRWAKRGK